LAAQVQRPAFFADEIRMAALNTLCSKFQDDEDMQELLELFASELPKKVASIQRLVAARDVAGLRTLCHQLKGAGGGYGFDSITELAAQAEAPLKDGATIEQVQVQVQALVDLLRSVQGYDPAAEAA
jgi:HPt (histidine-containing phosphotransfer) domain-containing protein